MRAITVTDDRLELSDIPTPEPTRTELLIRVTASGVNRADLAQRAGAYPPPAGASDILGLEVSGIVAAIGDDVTDWAVGDEVCALLSGGGYAEFVTVDAGLALPIPAGVDLESAAALPEAAATIWSNLVMVAGLRAGETVLLHGGSSGIGTMGIQIAAALGARVIVTAGSAEKLESCRALGAEVLVNYRDDDFVARVLEATDGRGVDVILDPIGADYLPRDVEALATNGRIVFIGTQSGPVGDLDLGALMRKRGSVHATTLRSRPIAERRAVIAEVRQHVWPLVASGRVRPVVDRVVPLEAAEQAHERMRSSAHVGKLLLATHV